MSDVYVVDRVVGSRISARNLFDGVDGQVSRAVIDFSENEACSISFIQELVRVHLVLNDDLSSILVFDNIRQSTASKIDYLFNSFPNVRERIIVENVREG